MKDQIDSLKLLSKKEIEIKYFKVFGYSAPEGYTKSYLIKEIAWQEKYNKLPADVQSRINNLVNEYTKALCVLMENMNIKI